MGMYDILGNEQVKCFWIPNFYVHKKDHFIEDGLHSVGGRLINYRKNIDLPLKTYYYHYPKNISIIDDNFHQGFYVCPTCGNKIDLDCDCDVLDFNEYFKSVYNKNNKRNMKYKCSKCQKVLAKKDLLHSPFLAHIITNGKYQETIYDVTKMNDKMLHLENGIITYYGNMFSFYKISQILNWIKVENIVFQKRCQICNSSNAILRKIMECRKNENSEEERQRLLSTYKKTLKRQNQKIIEMENKYLGGLSKYCVNNEDLKTFGSYIACYYNLLKLEDKDATILDINFKIDSLKQEFNEFIRVNPNIVSKYAKWQELSIKEVNKLIAFRK